MQSKSLMPFCEFIKSYSRIYLLHTLLISNIMLILLIHCIDNNLIDIHSHPPQNDGSVLGVRYFQCDAKCGVFSRLSKLSRYPIDNTVSISAGVGHTLPSQVGHALPSQVGHALPSHVGNSSSIKVLKPPPMPSVAAQGQTIAPNVVSGIVAATQPSKSLISVWFRYISYHLYQYKHI